MKASTLALFFTGLVASSLALPEPPRADGLSKEAQGFPLAIRDSVSDSAARPPTFRERPVSDDDAAILLIISTFQDALADVQSAAFNISVFSTPPAPNFCLNLAV